MSKLKQIIFIIGLLTVTWSCVEPISFSSADSAQLLVVDGQFTSTRSPHQLRLSYTSPFGAGPGQPVVGAQAVLSDNVGNSEAYRELGEGRYQLDGHTLQGVVGRQYTLRLSLADGQQYQSVPQTMPSPVQADSLKFAFEREEFLNQFNNVVRRNVINLYIDTPTRLANGDPAHLRWQTKDAFSFTEIDCGLFDSLRTCYITDQDFAPQRVEVYSADGTTETYLEHRNIGSKVFAPISREFTKEHYFNTYQYSTSPEAYQYWEQAAVVANPTGSIFAAQSANPRGNVINLDDEAEQVLGVFEVATVDTIRVLIIQEEILDNLYLAPYCAPGNFGDPIQECCDCLLIPESSYRKPDYWL